MKGKKLLVALTGLAAVMALASCGGNQGSSSTSLPDTSSSTSESSSSEAPEVTDVTVEVDEDELVLGDAKLGTAVAEATVDGTGDFDDSVTWKSDKTTVATVDSEGVIKGRGVGKTTITYLSEDNYLEDYIQVEVIASSGAVGTFEINFYDASKLTSTSGSNTNLAYIQSKTTIDGIVETGVVTASSPSGTVQYGKNGGLTLGASSNTGSITLTIANDYKVNKITVIGTSYDANSKILLGGKEGSGSMNAKGTAIEGCSNTVVWDDLNGATSLVFASSAKRATIYKIIGEYPTSSSTTAVTGISLQNSDGLTVSDGGSYKVVMGETWQLTAVVTPSNATDKSVTWTTSDSSVATVSLTGLVTPVSEGSATITATTTDGDFSASVNVLVEQAASTDSISINNTAIVTVGSTTTISATASGSVTWSYTNGTGTIALSNQSNTGVTISGLTAGSATVSATCGTETAECSVTVIAQGTNTSWTKVTDASSLKAGDIVTFACESQNAASGSLGANVYLASKTASFSSNTMTCNDAIEFVLGGTTGAWTLTSSEGKLSAQELKSLGWDGETDTWAITSSSGNANVSSTNTSFGKIQYNISSPRFLNYTSSQASIQLYTRGSSINPNQPKEVSSVTVNPTSLSLDVNGNGADQTGELTAFVDIVGSVGDLLETVTWSTGDPAVATVSNNGLVTAISAGSTTITATSDDDSSKFASCSVTVTANVRTLQSVEITTNPSKLTYTEGETFDPSGAVVKARFNYEPTLVEVTSDVTWTPTESLTTSNTKAFASYTVGGVTKTASVDITVNEQHDTNSGYNLITKLADLTDGHYVIAAKIGNTYYPLSNVAAATLDQPTGITVANNNISVADGAAYDYTISAMTGGYSLFANGNSKYLNGSTTSSFKTGSTATAWTIVQGTNGSFRIYNGSRGVLYSTSNNGVWKNYATSNATAGNTTYYDVELFKKTSSVTPPTPVAVTGVSLDKTSATLDIDDTLTLNATVNPSNADNKNVTWSSSDNSIATVSSSGVVTAVSSGTATITVTTEDGNFTATCAITVNEGGGGGTGGTGSYTIRFGSVTADGSSAISNDAVFGNITEGQSYVSSISDATNVFLGTTGLKLGTGSKTGSFKINLSDAGKVKVTSIVVGMRKYSSDTGSLSVTTNNGTASITPSDNSNVTEGTYNLTGNTTYISFATSAKRAYVSYIIVNYETSGGTSAETEAATWSTNFNKDLVCNNGVTAPSTSVWSTYATSYSELSSEAKTLIIGATYSISADGQTVSATNDTNEKERKILDRINKIINKKR